MAQPKLAIQAGKNKSGLDQADKDTAKDSEIKEYEQEFGLDEDTAEQEVIELDDGSVVINLKETKGLIVASPLSHSELSEVVSLVDGIHNVRELKHISNK